MNRDGGLGVCYSKSSRGGEGGPQFRNMPLGSFRGEGRGVIISGFCYSKVFPRGSVVLPLKYKLLNYYDTLYFQN